MERKNRDLTFKKHDILVSLCSISKSVRVMPSVLKYNWNDAKKEKKVFLCFSSRNRKTKVMTCKKHYYDTLRHSLSFIWSLSLSLGIGLKRKVVDKQVRKKHSIVNNFINQSQLLQQHLLWKWSGCL